MRASASLAALTAALLLCSGAASSADRLKVGLVLETVAVGKVTDPFQNGAFTGLKRAVDDLGVDGRTVAPAPNGRGSRRSRISLAAVTT